MVVGLTSTGGSDRCRVAAELRELGCGVGWRSRRSSSEVKAYRLLYFWVGDGELRGLSPFGGDKNTRSGCLRTWSEPGLARRGDHRRVEASRLMSVDDWSISCPQVQDLVLENGRV